MPLGPGTRITADDGHGYTLIRYVPAARGSTFALWEAVEDGRTLGRLIGERQIRSVGEVLLSVARLRDDGSWKPVRLRRQARDGRALRQARAAARNAARDYGGGRVLAAGHVVEEYVGDQTAIDGVRRVA